MTSDESGTSPSEPSGEFGILASVIKGAGINMFGTAFHVAMTFAYTIFLARVLDPSELGQYFLGFTIISLLVIVSVVGFDYALWRYIALYIGEKDLPRARGVVSVAIKIVLPLSIFLALALAISADFFANRVFEMEGLAKVLRLFSISLPFLALGKVFNSSTQGLAMMRYQVYSKNLAEQIAKFIFTALFIVAGLGLLGVMYANIIAPAITMIMALYFLNSKMPIYGSGRERLPEYRRVVRFASPMVLSATLGFLLLWVDTLWLGYFRSSGDVGLYSVATRVAILGTLVLTAFNTMMSPIIANLYNLQQNEMLQIIFKTVSRWVFVLTLPMFLIVIFFSSDVLRIFGPEFTAVASSLMVLAIGQFINSSTGPVAGMVVMSGRSGLEFFNNAAACLLNVILCLILIPAFGIIGAAIANASAIASVNLLRLGEVFILMKMQCFTLGHLRPLAAAAAATVIAFALDRFLSPENLLPTLLVFSVFVATYGISMLLIGVEDSDLAVARLIKEQLAKAS